MSYPEQFTPHVVSDSKDTFLDGWDYHPQCKEHVNAMNNAAFIYDLYFGEGGIIFDARKNSPN